VNPYEIQRRMAKACTIADKAEEMGFSASDLGKQDTLEWKQWAALCGVKPPSQETWDMVVDLLAKREVYNGPSGLEDPRFIQNLTKMAVKITETLDKNNVDSGEAKNLSKKDKRFVAKLAKANPDETTFDLGTKFLEMREEHRDPTNESTHE
tara:strand:+ start:904 stop:1359 length:456 start_codon:yes stop_codon:yes gene_type:complete